MNKSNETEQEEGSDNMRVIIISMLCAGVVLAVSMVFVSMRFRSMKETAKSPPVEFFQGGENLEGSRHFVGDLDADGSDALGNNTEDNADSDGELVMRDEDLEDDEYVPDGGPAPQVTEIV